MSKRSRKKATRKARGEAGTFAGRRPLAGAEKLKLFDLMKSTWHEDREKGLCSETPNDFWHFIVQQKGVKHADDFQSAYDAWCEKYHN